MDITELQRFNCLGNYTGKQIDITELQRFTFVGNYTGKQKNTTTYTTHIRGNVHVTVYYSYNTPIALLCNRVIYALGDRISTTTSKHRNYAIAHAKRSAVGGWTDCHMLSGDEFLERLAKL